MDPVQASSTPGTTQPAVTPDPTQASQDPVVESATGLPQTAPVVDPAATSPAAPVAPATGKVITIPSSAMGKLKADEREKGKAETLLALDTEAQSFGFANYAEMKAFAQQQKAGVKPPVPVAEPETPPAPPSSAQTDAQVAAQRDRRNPRSG